MNRDLGALSKEDRYENLKIRQELARQFRQFLEVWWAQRDLNPRPSDYESPALTAELWAHYIEEQ